GIGMGFAVEDDGLHARVCGAFERLRSRIVANQKGGLSGDRAVCASVEDGLHVAAAVRCQKSELHRRTIEKQSGARASVVLAASLGTGGKSTRIFGFATRIGGTRLPGAFF